MPTILASKGQISTVQLIRNTLDLCDLRIAKLTVCRRERTTPLPVQKGFA